MCTCQVNGEESAAQPLNRQRSASAAADDDGSMEPLAKHSRTHESGPHTVPGQEELVMQQHASAAAVRLQDQKDKEATRLAAQHILKENVARLHMRDQDAQLSLDFATEQTRAEAEQAKQQTELELDAAKEDFLLSCLPKKEGERARQQEEQSVPQRQADEESTSLRNQEREQLARDQERMTREMTQNLARDAADKRQRDLERAEEEADQQKVRDDKIAAHTKARAERVELNHQLEREAEAARQLAMEEEAAFKQQQAEQEAPWQPDWSGDQDKETSQEELDREHEEMEAARGEEEARQLQEALEMEDQEIAETEPAAQRSTLRRKVGLPTTIIQKSGDLWASKDLRHTRMVTKVFRTRLTLCQENGLDQDDVLPISVQKEGQHVLFQDWVLGTIGKRKQKEVIYMNFSKQHTTIIIFILMFFHNND